MFRTIVMLLSSEKSKPQKNFSYWNRDIRYFFTAQNGYKFQRIQYLLWQLGIIEISHLCSALENTKGRYNLHRSRSLFHIWDQIPTVHFKFLHLKLVYIKEPTVFSDMVHKSISGEDNETATHINCSTVLRDILGISCVMQSDRIDGLISINPVAVRAERWVLHMRYCCCCCCYCCCCCCGSYATGNTFKLESFLEITNDIVTDIRHTASQEVTLFLFKQLVLSLYSSSNGLAFFETYYLINSGNFKVLFFKSFI